MKTKTEISKVKDASLKIATTTLSSKVMVWVPFFVEKEPVREFYTMTVDEIAELVSLGKLEEVKKTKLEILREIRRCCYKSYVRLRPSSWWVKLDEETKYKVLFLLLDLLKEKANPEGKDFYKVYYNDGKKSFVLDFQEYILLKQKKEEKGKSILRQLKEKEEKRKKLLEKKENKEVKI